MAIPPLKFSGQETLSSYDFSDIASGTGIETYYGGQHGIHPLHASGAVTSGMILLPFTFYSDKITHSIYYSAGTTSNWQVVPGWDLDFDLKFNTTRTISGMVICNLPVGMRMVTGGSTAFAAAVATLYHVNSAGTETFLKSGMTMEVGAVTTGNSTIYDNIMSIGLNVNRIFKRNEKLRLNVIMWTRTTTGLAQDAYFGLGIDPMNRDDDATLPTFSSTTDTNLLIFLPFKLEVEI